MSDEFRSIPADGTTMSDDSNSRRYYRIPYPLRERPRLIVGNTEFLIAEISEGGARIKYASRPPAPFSRPFAATIAFGDGSEWETIAVLHRAQYGEFVLTFTRHIPLRYIASEQRRLLQQYPRHTKNS